MTLLKQYISILTFVLSLVLCGGAQAVTVAVFPVNDLSRDHNSMSSEMNKFVAEEVYKKGLEVLPHEKVLNYITNRRIRQIGYLETLEIMRTRTVLGADLVLLSSVCQQNSKSGTLGMTLSLVRTSDGRTVWANSKGVSLEDEQRFLGVNSPKDFEGLLPILAEKLFVDWPDDLNFTAGREFAGEQLAAVKETSFIQIESIFFTPKYVQPGKEVECVIRFKNNGTSFDDAQVSIKVGSRVYLAYSEDGIYFKAAWISPSPGTGEKVQVASVGNDSLIMKGVWSGDAKDADYPVSLILDWPSGKREESYLGSYVVDSIPPETSLKLKGKVFEGITSFRKNLSIDVNIKTNEPITKWEFRVQDSEGDEVLSERGRDEVPKSLTWRGQTRSNFRADSGVYTVSLEVWDRAGNSSISADRVALLDRVPSVDVSVVEDDQGVVATLSPKERVPFNSWRMELWSEDNILLKNVYGNNLPAKVRLDGLVDSIDKDNIGCILMVKDSLGSRSKREIKNMFAQLKTSNENEKDVEAAGPSDGWEVDF